MLEIPLLPVQLPVFVDGKGFISVDQSFDMRDVGITGFFHVRCDVLASISGIEAVLLEWS